MATEQIKMNGAGFRVSFLQSLSLEDFVAWGTANNVYRKYGDGQVPMLVKVWNLANGTQATYTVNQPKLVTKGGMLPKAVKITKSKK